MRRWLALLLAATLGAPASAREGAITIDDLPRGGDSSSERDLD